MTTLQRGNHRRKHYNPTEMTVDQKEVHAKQTIIRLRKSTAIICSVYLAIMSFAFFSTMHPNMQGMDTDGLLPFMGILPLVVGLIAFSWTLGLIQVMKMVALIHSVVSFFYLIFVLVHGIIFCSADACINPYSRAPFFVLFVCCWVVFGLNIIVGFSISKSLIRYTTMYIRNRHGGIDLVLYNPVLSSYGGNQDASTEVTSRIGSTTTLERAKRIRRNKKKFQV